MVIFTELQLTIALQSINTSLRLCTWSLINNTSHDISTGTEKNNYFGLLEIILNTFNTRSTGRVILTRPLFSKFEQNSIFFASFYYLEFEL